MELGKDVAEDCWAASRIGRLVPHSLPKICKGLEIRSHFRGDQEFQGFAEDAAEAWEGSLRAHCNRKGPSAQNAWELDIATDWIIHSVEPYALFTATLGDKCIHRWIIGCGDGEMDSIQINGSEGTRVLFGRKVGEARKKPVSVGQGNRSQEATSFTQCQ